MENNFDINKANQKLFWREINLYKNFENDIANQNKDLEIIRANIVALDKIINDIDQNIFNLQNQAKELQIQVRLHQSAAPSAFPVHSSAVGLPSA